MSLSLAHLLYSVTWSQCPTACVHVKHSSLTSTTAPPARVSILVVDENNYQDKRGSTLKWSMSTSSSLSSLLNEMSLKHGGNFFTTSRWRQYHFLLPVHKIIHTSVFNKWRQSVDSVPAFLMSRTHQNRCRLNVVCIKIPLQSPNDIDLSQVLSFHNQQPRIHPTLKVQNIELRSETGRVVQGQPFAQNL